MFTREQLLHLGILLGLLGILIGGIAFINHLYDKPHKNAIVFLPTDSLLQQLNDNTNRSEQHTPIPICLQAFDPNTADSAQLLQLGFRPFMAHSMLQYRRKGGQFRQKHDFKRMFFINDSLYTLYEPYLQLPDTFLSHYDSIRSGLIPKDSTQACRNLKKDTILELNTADTTQLIMLRGIGRSIAYAIVQRRKQLGGFASLQQLHEVRYINDSVYQLIAPAFTLDSSLIETIPVNTASIRRLMRHPYLRFEAAQAIYQLRREKVRLNSINELRGLPELSEHELHQLAPYLSFD